MWVRNPPPPVWSDSNEEKQHKKSLSVFCLVRVVLVKSVHRAPLKCSERVRCALLLTYVSTDFRRVGGPLKCGGQLRKRAVEKGRRVEKFPHNAHRDKVTFRNRVRARDNRVTWLAAIRRAQRRRYGCGWCCLSWLLTMLCCGD